jgi:hypothetical protein
MIRTFGLDASADDAVVVFVLLSCASEAIPGQSSLSIFFRTEEYIRIEAACDAIIPGDVELVG